MSFDILLLNKEKTEAKDCFFKPKLISVFSQEGFP